LPLLEGTFDPQGTTAYSISWNQSASEYPFAHSITFVTDSKTPEISKEQVLRILCHFLVDQVPPSGLVNVCEDIADSVKFFQTRSRFAAFLPQATILSGSIKTEKPPDFLLEE
jgi:hypothetical protein